MNSRLSMVRARNPSAQNSTQNSGMGLVLNRHGKTILMVLVASVLSLGGYWAWHTYLEKAWQSLPYTSDAARREPMLAAQQFLQGEGYTVLSHPGLGISKPGPDTVGVILLSSREAQIMGENTAKLLAWVSAGGVLITKADWRLDNPEVVDEMMSLGAYFHTWRDGETSVKEGAGAQAGDEVGDRDAAKAEVSKNDDPTEQTERSTAEAGELMPVEPGSSANNATNSAEPHPETTSDSDSTKLPCKCKPKLSQQIRPPASTYALEMSVGYGRLLAEENAPASLWGEANREQIVVYAHGQGRVVLLNKLPFENRELRSLDHAELLLRLVQLQTKSLPIWFVHNLDMPKWYTVLWQRVPVAVLALGLGLSLWLWAAWSRLGPLLPMPTDERRALLEHIDASARWHWQRPAGRELLLGAMRRAFMLKLAQRRPALAALSAPELVSRLAAEHAFTRAELERALSAPAAAQPALFSAQIHLLQTLRTHHE